MKEMDINDPRIAALYEKISDGIEMAWNAALEMHKCLGCANEQLRLEISAHDTGEWYAERPGISRDCKDCRKEMTNEKQNRGRRS